MKWAIREAVDVYFKAKSRLQLGARTIRAGEPVLIFDTVQTSTLEVAAEIAYVTGGRGNARILSFEGDKTLTFNFEDALLSNEGLAILSGADLIPARNRRLPGSHPDARPVIAHYTEKYAVTRTNVEDMDNSNTFPRDPAIPGIPRGGIRNVWLSRKPFVGQNASIYVMLLDNAGEMSGSPVEINLANTSPSPAVGFTIPGGTSDVAGTNPNGSIDRETGLASTAAGAVAANRQSYLAKFNVGDAFIAIDRSGNPIPWKDPEGDSNLLPIAEPIAPDPALSATGGFPAGAEYDLYRGCANIDEVNAVFDDVVVHYVDAQSVINGWVTGWRGTAPDAVVATGGGRVPMPIDPDDRDAFVRYIGTTGGSGVWNTVGYRYLLAPSGGIAQPKAFKEGAAYFYQVNVPSILFQDIVLIDQYVEHRRNATQISILPDKFGPFLYVEGSSLVRRASDGMDLPAEFVIPKFKITTALTFTMAATGDPGTFNFQGDAYPDFSKFDLTRRVLADIQVLDADDNFDTGFAGAPADPTSYRRFHYMDNDGEYLWKDPSMQPHQNLDFADPNYMPAEGGPATRTPGEGLIDSRTFRTPA